MRLKNFHTEPLVIPHIMYRWKDDKDQFVSISYSFDAGEVTAELDPEDPLTKSLLLGGLQEIKLPSAWDRILRPQF
jgi:hypothetical protein